MTLQLERSADEPRSDPGPPRRYNTALIAAAVVLAVALVVIGVYLAQRSDGDDAGFGLADDTSTSVGETPTSTAAEGTTATTAAPASSTATSAASTTSTTSASSTVTAAPVSQPVVWPDPGQTTGFDTPENAARSFAVDLAGFAEPVIGEFRAGDSRSGEIDVQPGATGPITTILVRQVGSDDSWWVIGATSEDIVISQPSTGQTLTASMRLTGEARAFEGTVDVALFVHGQADPVVSGFVTGRGDGVLGPFDESFDLPAGIAGPGMLLLTSAGGEDGTAWTVAAIPVQLG